MATQDFALVCFLLSLVYIHKDVYMQLFMVMLVKPRTYQGSMHKNSSASPCHEPYRFERYFKPYSNNNKLEGK